MAAPTAPTTAPASIYRSQLRAALEQNRRAVSDYAAGGGGTAAHRADLTTRGHIWLLPPDSPLRRPWRSNMVAVARPATADVGHAPIQIAQPLTEHQINALRHQCTLHSASSIPSDDCAICYTPMSLGFGTPHAADACIVRLPCGGGHVFHFRCVEPWLRKAKLCPTCRGTLRIGRARNRPQTQQRRRAQQHLPPVSTPGLASALTSYDRSTRTPLSVSLRRASDRPWR